MNEYTFLFCIMPIAVGVGLPVLYVVGHLQAIAARNAHEEAKEDARERVLLIREAKAARDLELHEAKLAAENNKVVLQDAKLRIEFLKEKELAYKTRHMDPDAKFNATDFEPRASDAPPPAQN